MSMSKQSKFMRDKHKAKKLRSQCQKTSKPTHLKNRTHRNKLNVTDHALVRYMERAMDQDFEMIRKAILSDKLKQFAEATKGNGIFRLDGFVYIIINNQIVTVKPESMYTSTTPKGAH